MKVTALETIKAHPYYPAEGDTITVPDPVGQNWVDNGWAKNAETGETGQRSSKPVTLEIDSSILSVSSEVK